MKGYENMSNKNKLSTVLKDIMTVANVDQKDAANVIDKPLGSFRNKLSLDRFSIHEIMMLAEICGYHLALIPENEKNETKLLLADEFLSEEELQSIKNFKKSRYQYQLNLLQSMMDGMSPEEKKAFLEKNFEI